MNAGIKGMAWVEKEVGRLDRKKLRELASAASVTRTRDSSDADLRTAIIAYIALQVGLRLGESIFLAASCIVICA